MVTTWCLYGDTMVTFRLVCLWVIERFHASHGRGPIAILGGTFIVSEKNSPVVWQHTMGQNQVILETSKIHFPTSEGVSEVSEQVNE